MHCAELGEGLIHGLVGDTIHQAPKDQMTRGTVDHRVRREDVVDGDMRRKYEFAQSDGDLSAITGKEATGLGIESFIKDG